MKPTIQEQITEVKREIGLRRFLYPQWRSARKYTDQQLDRQMDRMLAVLETLEEVERMLAAQNPDPVQTDLMLSSEHAGNPF